MAENTPSRPVIWWKTIRPATLLAAFGPVWLGTAVALHSGVQPGIAAALALVCAVCIQVLVNLHNDKEDFLRGADTDQRLGEARAAQKGWLTPNDLNRAIWFVAGVATVGALGLTLLAGPIVLGIGLVSMLSAFAYTGGPFPLAYNGLGDVFVFLFFGLIAVTGTTFVITGEWLQSAALVGAIAGFQATAILVVNNIRDARTDELAGKRTVVVRWGHRFGQWEYTALHIATYATLAFTLFVDLSLPLACSLGFLTVPLAIQGTRAIWTKTGTELNPYLGQTAKTGFLTSMLVGGGLCL